MLDSPKTVWELRCLLASNAYSPRGTWASPLKLPHPFQGESYLGSIIFFTNVCAAKPYWVQKLMLKRRNSTQSFSHCWKTMSSSTASCCTPPEVSTSPSNQKESQLKGCVKVFLQRSYLFCVSIPFCLPRVGYHVLISHRKIWSEFKRAKICSTN